MLFKIIEVALLYSRSHKNLGLRIPVHPESQLLTVSFFPCQEDGVLQQLRNGASQHDKGHGYPLSVRQRSATEICNRVGFKATMMCGMAVFIVTVSAI